MDEKVLEEIQFHQDVVTKDANSPLYQIREKEMEISGRVLAARGEADRLITHARQNAADLLKSEQQRAQELAQQKAEAVAAETEAALARLAAEHEREIAALQERLKTRREEAAALIVKSVTGA